MVIASGAGDVYFSGLMGGTDVLSGLDVNKTTAGTGDITFKGNIGTSAGTDQPGIVGTTAIGTTTTENVHFKGSLYRFDGGTTTITATTDSDSTGAVDDENIEVAVTAEFKAAGEALTFAGGKIDLANGANLTLTNSSSSITVSGIAGDSDETVSINAGTGSVSLGAVGDTAHAEIHNLTVAGDAGITLTGAIYTSGGADDSGADITFSDLVIISGTVIIDSDDDDASSVNLDGDIVFNGSINGTDGTTDNLTIEGGSGAITLVAIGASEPLEALTINSQATGVTTLTVPNIGTGAINNAAPGVKGNVAIGNTNTAGITMSGLIYNVGNSSTAGGITLTTAAGNTTQAEINFTGGTDADNPFIGTAAGNITLAGGEVKLANKSDLTLNSNRLAGTASGNISIAKGIDGTSDEDLTITTTTSGAGTISLGPVGQGTFTAAADGVSEINTFTVTGAGAITLNGDIQTSDAATAEVSITGDVVLTSDADNAITIDTDTANDGNVTITGNVDGTNLTDQVLIIVSGTGNVSIGSIGTTASTTNVKKIEIDKADGQTGTIAIGNIGASGYAGADGAVLIGGLNSGTVTLSGTIYNFDSTVAFQAAAAGSR